MIVFFTQSGVDIPAKMGEHERGNFVFHAGHIHMLRFRNVFGDHIGCIADLQGRVLGVIELVNLLGQQCQAATDNGIERDLLLGLLPPPVRNPPGQAAVNQDIAAGSAMLS